MTVPLSVLSEGRIYGFGGFSDAMLDCELDFPRPPFYNKLFELWGLEQGEDWKLG